MKHVTTTTDPLPLAADIRLRPAPHSRTPILSYSLKVEPAEHFENWQQDPHGNFLARIVFPERTRSLNIAVDLIAELTVINPFDFFIESSAEQIPFEYEPWLARELRPYLEVEPLGPRLEAYLAKIGRPKMKTVDRLVELNQRLQEEVRYLIRMEPGVQLPRKRSRSARAVVAIRPGCWCRSCAAWGWRPALCRATSCN